MSTAVVARETARGRGARGVRVLERADAVFRRGRPSKRELPTAVVCRVRFSFSLKIVRNTIEEIARYGK